MVIVLAPSSPRSWGNANRLTLVTPLAGNLVGLTLGAEASCQPFVGGLKGTLITGNEPISCSSKHSSAGGLVVTELSSGARSPVTDDGRETVAVSWELGISNACLLDESTVGACLAGGELLRPINELILSCQFFASGSSVRTSWEPR